MNNMLAFLYIASLFVLGGAAFSLMWKNLIDVKKKLYIKYTLSYKLIFQYKDAKLGKDFGVWRPIPPKNFYSFSIIFIIIHFIG